MSQNTSPTDLTKIQDQLKSIVYGDVVKNKYGAFRCFCATVSDEGQIESIVSYLRKNVSFHRLNKFSYSYRISQNLDGNQIMENYYNDARLDGCGEKILHLLQKFNVENVLLVIGIDRKETYGLINAEYYHTIVERAKDLLSTLYEKVIENDLGVLREDLDVFLTQAPEQVKGDGKKRELIPAIQTVNLDSIPLYQKPTKIDRPNHFLTSDQRQRLEAQMQKSQMPSLGEREKLLNSVLRNNLKRNNEKIVNVMGSWQDNDYQHLKFISLYDKTARVAKVFKVLMILEDIKNPDEMSQTYDYKRRLPLLAETHINKERCKKVTDMIRQDKSLTAKALARENHVVSSLLEFLTLLVRNHELAEKISALHTVKPSTIREDLKRISYELRNSKTTFEIEEDKQEIKVDTVKDYGNPLRDYQRTDGSYHEVDNRIVKTRSGNFSPSKSDLTPEKRQNDDSKQRETSSRPKMNDHNILTKPSYDPANQTKKSESINISEEFTPLEPKLGGGTGGMLQRNQGTPQQKAYQEKINVENNASSRENNARQDKSNKSQREKTRESSERSPKIEDYDPQSPTTSNQFAKRFKKGVTSDFEEVEELGEEYLQGVPNENIPDDPEEIRKFLIENPMEGLTNNNLEMIVEKLEVHRGKSS